MENIFLLVILILALLLIIAVFGIAILAYQYFSYKSRIDSRIKVEQEKQTQIAYQQAQEHLRQWREQEQEEFNKQAQIVHQQAQDNLQQWREQELDLAKKQLLATARAESEVLLNQWKSEFELKIRQDAVQKSRSVTVGKITEHIIPYLPDFPYNPKDARFIGSPIDLVVFNGLDEGEVREVVFIEIKTGSSSLSTRERRVRDAILARNVNWLEIRSANLTNNADVEQPDNSLESIESGCLFD